MGRFLIEVNNATHQAMAYLTVLKQGSTQLTRLARQLTGNQRPTGLIRNPMGIARRQHDNVHLLHGNRIMAIAAYETSAREGHMKTGIAAGFHGNAPGCRKLRAEENGAPETQRFQHVAEHIKAIFKIESIRLLSDSPGYPRGLRPAAYSL